MDQNWLAILKTRHNYSFIHSYSTCELGTRTRSQSRVFILFDVLSYSNSFSMGEGTYMLSMHLTRRLYMSSYIR